MASTQHLEGNLMVQGGGAWEEDKEGMEEDEERMEKERA
jgi:hypothetical protein